MTAYETGRTVAMSPDSRIQWRAYSLSYGTLLLPPDEPAAVSEILGQKTHWRDRIGKGSYGIVWRVPCTAGTLAVKEFGRWMGGGGMPDLMANVTLTAGLERTRSCLHNWEILGVQVLGALITNPDDRHSPRTRWVMERVAPERKRAIPADQKLHGLPQGEDLAKHYERAMRVYGGRPADYNFDDQPNNLLLVYPPSETEKGLAYKIDIMAAPHAREVSRTD